jgi:hypothetical protein
MGTSWVGSRADLTPVYKIIFLRLKALDLDWRYHFPRLQVVDMRPVAEALEQKKREESGEPEWADYDPSAELEKEDAKRQKDEEIAELRESLNEGYRESIAEAKTKEPPRTVRAYQAVFGEFPSGWPPEPETD